MGKRLAVVELFLGDMGSIQRELRPSTQREDQLTMETKLEQIAVKAVNQLPKSVVREICTPRSVGAGGGRPRVDRIFQIDTKRLPGIKTTGDSNERLGQVGIDAPVAHRIRIGQGIAGYAAADAHVIELARLCSQASFDVAQAFAVGKLRERHAEILIKARKRFDFVFAPVTRYAA